MRYFFILLFTIINLLAAPYYCKFEGDVDGWDAFRNDDRNISTKISGKEFNLTVVHFDDDGKEAKFTGTLCIKVGYEPWQEYSLDDESRVNLIAKIKHSYKDINLHFKWLGGAFESGMTCASFKPTNINNNYLPKCGESYSTDNFAVIPQSFKIESNQSIIRAGRDFNITFLGLDIGGNAVKEYDENVTDTFEVLYRDLKDANLGKFDPEINDSWEFKDGNKTFTTKYSEVGELNITIKEKDKCSDRFAAVDCDDKNVSDHWNTDTDTIIKDSYIILKFVPDHFDVNLTIKDKDFVYISSDLNMSAVAEVNITAKNYDNNITENYSRDLYSKRVDINISYDNIDDSIPKFNYILEDIEDNNISGSFDSNKLIQLFLSDSNFSKGITNFKLYFNLEKNYTTPIGVFKFKFNDINVTDINNTDSNKTINGEVEFRYGRLKVFNKAGYNKTLKTKILYQYYDKNKGWIINNLHNEDYGKIKSYYSKEGIEVNFSKIVDGIQEVNLSTTYALPISFEIALDIDSWLWYNPLAKPYKSPSKSNQDCLTHPCFNVSFLRSSKGWAGIKIKNSKFSENNRTIELNSTNFDTNESKSEVKRLNW